MVAKSGLCAALGINVFDYGWTQGRHGSDENFMGKACAVASWVQTMDRT
jgi:hypothetical protein